MFPKLKNFLATVAAAILFAVCIAPPARAQVAPTVLRTETDGFLTITLSSSNPTDEANVNNTYTWTVTNVYSQPLTSVILGSHWGDYCVGSGVDPASNSPLKCPIAAPEGPTLISLGTGCGSQTAFDFDTSIATLGIWCTTSAGVTLAPGASISGSVTIRPRTGGPAYYSVYTSHDPVTPPLIPTTNGNPLLPFINYHGVVAAVPTDVQITGAASTGSPLVGSDFTYTYQIHNGGPLGTFGGIIFQDVLPASLNFVSVTVEEAVIDQTTGQQELVVVQGNNSLSAPCSLVPNPDQTKSLVCTLQDLTLGGVANTAKVILTVSAPGPAGPISNTASVHTAAAQDDSKPANNSVTVNVATR